MCAKQNVTGIFCLGCVVLKFEDTVAAEDGNEHETSHK